MVLRREHLSSTMRKGNAMSEPIINNDDEGQEVTAEEIEQSKSVDLRALGIEPLQTEIPALLKFYRAVCSRVKGFQASLKDGRNETTDPEYAVTKKLERGVASKDENQVKVRTEIHNAAVAIADVLWEAVEADNTLFTSLLWINELQSVLDDLKDNHDYFFANAVQNMKTKLGVSVSPSEEAIQAKLTAIKLDELIRNRINIAKAMELELPENLWKTSEAGRVGFNADLFPRIPKLEMGDAAPKSKVSSVRLAFRWVTPAGVPADEQTEVSVPAEWTLNDVAHNLVSKGSYRVSGRTIEKMLKDAKLGIGATDNEWSLDFQTGTLYGKKGSNS